MPKGKPKTYRQLVKSGTTTFFRKGRRKFTLCIDEALFERIKRYAHTQKQSFNSTCEDFFEWGLEDVAEGED